MWTIEENIENGNSKDTKDRSEEASETGVVPFGNLPAVGGVGLCAFAERDRSIRTFCRRTGLT
jgi:hypothetical protein